MSLRLALLGTGSMAEYQLGKFSSLDGVEVTACFDVDQAKADQFAAHHGLSRAFDSWDRLFDTAPDAVSCCLVDSLHHEAGRAALERGVALFAEKPLAHTLPCARELARLASDGGTVAMVNLSKRNAPALHALAALLDDGALGTVRAVEAAYRQGWVKTKAWGDWNEVPRWKWRLQNEFCTAGVVGDLGVHLMDALIHLWGVPQGTRARLHDLASAVDAGLVAAQPTFPTCPGRHPAYVDLEAELAFGSVPCHFSLSWIDETATDSFRIQVEGTRATALLDLERSRTAVVVSGPGGEREVAGPPTASTYQKFVEAVRSGRALSPTVTDALAAQEALEQLLPPVAL